MRPLIRGVAACVLAALPVTASAQFASLAPGMPYAGARRALLGAGYEPYHLPRRVLTRTACGGDARICESYPEAAACAGTGRADCEFLFAKGATAILVVHTVGETPSTLTILYIHSSTRAIVDGAY